MYKWIIDLDAEREEYNREIEEFEKEFEEDEGADAPADHAEKDFDSGDWDGMTEEEFLDLEGELIANEGVYISVGDEVSCEGTRGGIVLGRICNHDGDAVCYKIWVSTDVDNAEIGYIDFVQADSVIFHELCGSTEWSLKRIGYELIEEEDTEFSYFYNKKTGDIALW